MQGHLGSASELDFAGGAVSDNNYAGLLSFVKQGARETFDAVIGEGSSAFFHFLYCLDLYLTELLLLVLVEGCFAMLFVHFLGEEAHGAGLALELAIWVGTYHSVFRVESGCSAGRLNCGC
jgi:hypothetical protein